MSNPVDCWYLAQKKRCQTKNMMELWHPVKDFAEVQKNQVKVSIISHLLSYWDSLTWKEPFFTVLSLFQDENWNPQLVWKLCPATKLCLRAGKEFFFLAIFQQIAHSNGKQRHLTPHVKKIQRSKSQIRCFNFPPFHFTPKL